jgi:hypothetical protein
MVDE